MPKKKKIDLEKFAKAIDSGVPNKEIMKQFGIKTTAQLKAFYFDALVSRGVAKPITGRGGKADY